MKNLKEHAERCMMQLFDLNVPIQVPNKWEINSRAKSRWGLCAKTPDGYVIQINADLLRDDIDDQALDTTIMHELLHTIEGGMNHTGIWKRYAERVSCYTGLNIQRTTVAAEKGFGTTYRPRREYKYKVTCNGCGHEWKYTKKATAVTDPGHCWCPFCGRGKSKLFVTVI